jgi:D-methionine transport system ATP-binding protein
MIELANLVKEYRGPSGTVKALDGVSLSVGRGEVLGVIGRSGAGKSTLIRCANLLERPTSGSVRVGGQELTTLGAAQLRDARRSIGMIFQHFNLLSSRTVFGNVALPLELAGHPKSSLAGEVLPLLELAGLSHKRDRHPAELSGGEKQRVGIARALASKPSVLLCDEATSSLDPETTRAILRLLRDINRRLGLTILLITHEMQVIKEICDRVVVLEHGRVVDQGPVFEVFTAPRAEVTRSFVRDLIERELPPHLAERLRAAPAAGHAPLLRVISRGAATRLPLFSEAAQRSGALVNLLHGTIDEIQGQAFANVLVELLGSPPQVEAALALLRTGELEIQELGNVARDA